MEAIRKIDRKIKKVLTMYKMHHPKLIQICEKERSRKKTVTN